MLKKFLNGFVTSYRQLTKNLINSGMLILPGHHFAAILYIEAAPGQNILVGWCLGPPAERQQEVDQQGHSGAVLAKL